MLAGIVSIAVLSTPAVAEAAFPGPNGRIFFSAAGVGASAPDVWSVEPDGSGLANLTDLPGGPGEGRDPAASGDGSRLAFVVGDAAAAEIWTISAHGSNPQRLTANADADLMPAISADGSLIAFASDRDPAASGLDIWVMGIDGSSPHLLVGGPGREEHPQFSPDGLHVALASASGGDLDIVYVPAGGGPHAGATTVTEFSDGDETTPSIKPDGSRVAYTTSDGAGGQSDIYDVFFNGTDFLPVAADPSRSERSPAYSPDGTQIVYSTPDGLVVAAAGGADPRRLETGVAASPADPDWAVGPPHDAKPPQTTITRASIGEAKRRAAFRFTSTEAGSRFECRLDRARFESCVSPQRYRRLRPGRHRFRVRATDPAGNTDPSPAKARFGVRPS